MRYGFFIIPNSQRLAATVHCASIGEVFETHVWRHNVPDPPIDDWDRGIELTAAPAAPDSPVTHRILWGEVDETKFSNWHTIIPGARVYWQDEGWDRNSAMADAGLAYKPYPLEEWEL